MSGGHGELVFHHYKTHLACFTIVQATNHLELKALDWKKKDSPEQVIWA